MQSYKLNFDKFASVSTRDESLIPRVRHNQPHLDSLELSGNQLLGPQHEYHAKEIFALLGTA